VACISSICRRLLLAALAPVLAGITPVYGDSHLLYFEAQGVAGYSSQKDRAIYYSMNPDGEMQKNSVG